MNPWASVELYEASTRELSTEPVGTVTATQSCGSTPPPVTVPLIELVPIGSVKAVGPDRLRLDAVPDPQPGPGEVVVRLKAAALNHRDVWIRRGQYAGIKLPVVLGSDGAGTVSAVGPAADPKLLGKEVVINPGLDW